VVRRVCQVWMERRENAEILVNKALQAFLEKTVWMGKEDPRETEANPVLQVETVFQVGLVPVDPQGPLEQW